MNILLAVDGSPNDEAVIDAVLQHRAPGETMVKVLHVLEPPPLLVTREMGGYDAELDSVLQSQREEAETNVQKIAGTLRSHGFLVSSVVEYGDAKAKILELAAGWPADLIVLGSDVHGSLDGLLSRSVSQSVARHALCSVEIVRTPLVHSPERSQHAHTS